MVFQKIMVGAKYSWLRDNMRELEQPNKGYWVIGDSFHIKTGAKLTNVGKFQIHFFF